MTVPRGPGRPALPDAERGKVRGIRFTAQQWSEVQRKAEAAGMTAAAWVRMRCGV